MTAFTGASSSAYTYMRESIDYSAFEQNVWHLTDFPPKALDTGLHRHFHSVHFDINAAFIVRAGFFSFSEAVRAGFLLLLKQYEPVSCSTSAHCYGLIVDSAGLDMYMICKQSSEPKYKQ